MEGSSVKGIAHHGHELRHWECSSASWVTDCPEKRAHNSWIVPSNAERLSQMQF